MSLSNFNFKFYIVISDAKDLEEGKDYEVISSTLNKNPNESVQMEGNEHQNKVLYKSPYQVKVCKTKDH